MKRIFLKWAALCAVCLFTLGASATPDKDYLCFTANTGGSTVKLITNGSPTKVTLQTSTDGANWSDYTIGDVIALANVGSKVYFRNANDYIEGNTTFSTNSSNFYLFSMTGSIAASGNVMSLVDPSCKATTIPCDYCFNYLFYSCTVLTTAPELPATTLATNCYRQMFSGCGALTTAPELPATTLKDNCYDNMFSNCTSLTTAPELPATTLAIKCYYQMFYCCSKLTTAPTALPATTLATSCYENMFYRCTALTTAPTTLPATTLADKCYSSMFYGCTKLATAPELPATTLASSCYSNMFSGCTKLATAPELPATTLADKCYTDMFSSCTNLTTAPELPATTLASSCYSNMFHGCKALTTAPELPATTLASSCYSNMFSDCTSLTTAPELPATMLADKCYTSMFYGCTKLATAPELPATTLASSCYQSMFYGCTKLATAPELPATTLASSCYSSMFYGCTILATAPELPATTLTSSCYTNMFYNCKALTTAPELPATTLAEKCYNNMFNRSSLLTDVKVAFSAVDATNATTNWLNSAAAEGTILCPSNHSIAGGANGIPAGWTDKNTYDVTGTAIGWTSLCVNLPLTVPEGAEVYYASAAEGSTITLTQIAAGTTMAPRTAIIVKADENTTVQFPISIATATSFTNLFQGSSVAKAKAEDVYVLAGANAENGNPQFQEYSGTTLGAHKIWLPKSAVGGASGSIQFRFDDATAINTIEMESSDDAIYNMAGQRASSDYRGIVIKNGKKMWNN